MFRSPSESDHLDAAAAFLAKIMQPDVSLSRRWTGKGLNRLSRSTTDRTELPTLSPGWDAKPAGLSTMRMSSFSKRILIIALQRTGAPAGWQAPPAQESLRYCANDAISLHLSREAQMKIRRTIVLLVMFSAAGALAWA